MFTNTYNDIYNDILYFKTLYPDSIMDIYNQVSDYSDKLEYNGSLMYDEFPDKERIRSIAAHIYNTYSCPSQDISAASNNRCCPSPELIEILLINEFIHRRVRRRAFQ